MAVSKRDLGKQLHERLTRSFDETYTTPTGGERVTKDGIESWHARGTEHYLAQQLETRLQKMDAAHKRDMANLANQVISMNNAMEARVMHINGFYTWLIETYPETVAQYKALLNLKRLTEGEE